MTTTLTEQIVKFVRCPINKPNSIECNYELCALKSNKKTPCSIVAAKITDIPRKEKFTLYEFLVKLSKILA